MAPARWWITIAYYKCEEGARRSWFTRTSSFFARGLVAADPRVRAETARGMAALRGESAGRP
jgi:hypothetical protein